MPSGHGFKKIPRPEWALAQTLPSCLNGISIQKRITVISYAYKSIILTYRSGGNPSPPPTGRAGLGEDFSLIAVCFALYAERNKSDMRMTLGRTVEL